MPAEWFSIELFTNIPKQLRWNPFFTHVTHSFL